MMSLLVVSVCVLLKLSFTIGVPTPTESTIVASTDVNFANQTSIIYDNANVTDTIISTTIINETSAKDIQHSKTDGHQEHTLVMSTQLEEQLVTLSCDLPELPAGYRLWKGNETHELLLPRKASLIAAN